MGLFSKKPGGTFFGNLLRSAGQSVSTSIGMPGLLGSGQNMIPIGGTMSNAQYSQQTATLPSPAVITSPGYNTGYTASATDDLTKNPMLMYAGIGLLAYFMLKKK